ncbi:hypothetical protein ACFQER_15995 [Halomicroarcula sp. GCM10025894]|uniref:hypothetical protein n=1 Tax=Halomicroarcula sp. GCM10025894 TaxID=3252673 RepID=UPI0036112FBA
MTAAELRERREEESARRISGYDPAGVDTSKTSPKTEATGLDAFATDGGVEQ